MLRIDYRPSDWRAVLSWEKTDEGEPWLEIVRRLLVDSSDDVAQENAWQVSMPWWGFVALRDRLLEIFSGFGVRLGSGLEIGTEAVELLRQARRSASGYLSARDARPIPEQEIRERLQNAGFTRELSPEQIRNVGILAAIPAGATFSVPGAGKTTEALACFFLKADSRDTLLVIAPKNAFASWDEQLSDCVPDIEETFVRLRGGREAIDSLLQSEPRFMLITYQQLARVSDLIAAHCARTPVHVFLDESHRIKSGVERVIARSTLTLSHLPVGKLIMSGTPMPQAPDDLIPQFSFLYPEIPVDADAVVNLIAPVYVRTTKEELGLPPVNRLLISLSTSPLQGELYNLMKYEVARQAATALGAGGKQAFRALGRSVAKLLMFISNPALLSSDLEFSHPELLAAVLAEGDGPKVRFVLRRARALAREGNKVLIWSSFRRNVEYLCERLSDVGAVYIHGGVDAGDEDDDESREGKIRKFHDDPNTMVLVANPAAAGEGVSLHRVCHHAIYLDRTFNAAHYLQSEDRIHRFGLPPGQETNIEIVECKDTIDETVRLRLNYKITAMADALNDSSLRPDPIPLDPSNIEDYEEYSTGLSAEDIEMLLKDIGGGNGR